MATGSPVQHVGGGDRRVSTNPTVYGTPRPMRTIIDWGDATGEDAARVGPRCRMCGQRGHKLHDDLCGECRRVAEARFTAPPTPEPEPATEPRKPMRGKLAPHADDIARRYEQGESNAVLARAYGVSSPAITQLLKRMGVPLRRPSPPTKRSNRSSGGKVRSAQVDYVPREVRAWARSQGIAVPTHGRYLPTRVVQAWRAATGGGC